MNQRVLLWVGSAALLLSVFLAYLQPDIAFTLANQIWFCS